MGINKWLSGILGWALGGPIGALLGFSLGALLERGESGRDNRFSAFEGERNSFMISLLVLSAAVMKSDGKVMRSELEYVKSFIRTNFGEAAVSEALQIIKGILEKEIDLPAICGQIKVHMDNPQRLQLLHYLAGIAKADGRVSEAEIEMLEKTALYLGISRKESAAILAMYRDTLEDAYKVLEITSEATDEQVKRAYKKMAFKHHPDRVESLGSDVRKAAEERFKAVADAYEKIKKARGFN